MRQQDLLRYIREHPGQTISEIARAHRSPYYETQKAVAQMEEAGIVVSTMTNGSSANQKVVWNVPKRL